MRQAVHPPLPEDVALAEVEAMEQLSAEDMRVDMPAIPGALNANYIAPSDEAAWIPAWKLEPDWKGREIGRPVRLPVGQLSGPSGLLRARRADGKPCFTLRQPQYVQGDGTIPCFVGTCRKKLRRRIDLVMHVRGFHQQEAQVYKAVLEQIEQKAMFEDERLQALIASLDEMEENPEPIDLNPAKIEEPVKASVNIVVDEAFTAPLEEPVQEEPVAVRIEREPEPKIITPVETEAGESNLSLKSGDCPICGWMAPSRNGLAVAIGYHIVREHKEG